MKNTGKRIFALALVGLLLTGCGFIPAAGTAGSAEAACAHYRQQLSMSYGSNGGLRAYLMSKVDECRRMGI